MRPNESKPRELTVFAVDILNGVDSNAGEGDAVAPHDPTASQGLQKYGELMRLRIVHVAALFIFAYVGVEVGLASAEYYEYSYPCAVDRSLLAHGL